jgi:prophage regulatory protein
MASNEARAAISQLTPNKPNPSLPTIPGDCVLRFAEVRQKTGHCRAHVHSLAAQGRFPKPLKLVPGGRASGWLLSEINAWSH